MAEDNQKKTLLLEIAGLGRRFQKDGDLAPVADIQEWERLVASKQSEERDLLRELTRFADLWRYSRERGEKLGPGIVDAIRQLHNLAVPERARRLKEINQELMERVNDVGEGAQFRH